MALFWSLPAGRFLWSCRHGGRHPPVGSQDLPTGSGAKARAPLSGRDGRPLCSFPGAAVTASRRPSQRSGGTGTWLPVLRRGRGGSATPGRDAEGPWPLPAPARFRARTLSCILSDSDVAKRACSSGDKVPGVFQSLPLRANGFVTRYTWPRAEDQPCS